MKKKSNVFTKILKFTGGTFLVLIAAAIAIPYFFKDELITKLKTEINNNVKATVDFEDVNLSILRGFPDFNLRLEGLEVVGVEEFEGLRLLGVENADVRLDLMSVISSDKPIEIERIVLDEPNIYVKVLRDGTANYDITLPAEEAAPETTTGESTPFEIKLRSYKVSNANVTYDDASSDMFLDIVDLNHEGKGNFTESIYDLATKTTAKEMTVQTGGIAYINKAETDIDMTININMNDAKYTLKDNQIKLNALQLNLDGWVAMPADDIDMDLSFSSPSTSFKDLLSMIPAAYTEDFGSVKADGQMELSGKAKGVYNENTYPTFSLNLKAEDGSFKYPDLPIGMSNINTNVAINSPSSNLNDMVINVSKFHIDLGKNPFDARFLLKTPMTDPNVDAKVKGKIILDDLAKAFPLDEQGIETLSGIINADIETQMRMSAVTNEAYDQVKMKGSLGMTNVNYVAAGMPKVVVKDMQSDFTPEQLELKNFEAQLGKSDLMMRGRFDNLLTYFSGEKTMKGNLFVRSNKFDVNEWMTTEGGEEAVNEPTANIEDTTSATTEATTVPDRFDFDLDAEIGDLVYDAYDIKDLTVVGNLKPETMVFEELSTKVGKSDFHLYGHLDNAMGYALSGETLKGTVVLYSQLFDADDLMEMAAGTESEAADDAPQVETTTNQTAPKENQNEIFGKFDVNADLKVDQMKYDIYNITDMEVIGHIRNDKMALNSYTAKVGKSDFSGKGLIIDMFDYLYGGGTVSGELVLNSNYIDADELMYGEGGAPTETTESTAPEKENPTPTESTNKGQQPDEVFGKFDLLIDGNIKKMKYDVYNISNMAVEGQLGHDVIRLDNMKMYLGNSDIQMKGVVQNAIDYLYRDAKLVGQVELNSKFLDVNQFMVTDEATVEAAKPEQPVATSSTEMEPFPVPENMDFVIKANLDKVLYSTMDMQAVKGNLLVQNEEVDMQDISANIFGGNMKINGKYDTKDIENPKFAFAYDLSQFSIQDAFKKTVTVQKIAPIAKFVEGKMNSTFSINGILGKDMMPKWNTLNGKGLLETFNTLVKNYAPFNDLASKLKVEELKDIVIKESKNWFEIKDGKVELQPFDFDYKDMKFNIGGQHGIDQDIDYTIKMNVPRSKFKSNAAVALIDKGINLANSDAQYVAVDIGVKGNVTKPKFNIKKVDLGGKGYSSDKITEEKEKLKDTADSLKQDAEKKLQEQIAKQEAAAKAKADSVKKVLAEQIKKEQEKAAEELKKKANEIGDKLGDKTKEELDKVKDKVGDDAKKKVEEELEKLKVNDKAKEELDKLKNKIKLPKWGKKKNDGGK